MQRLAAYLELTRLSNLPTCFTNVLVGLALAGSELVPSRLFVLFAAVTLFYAGGMALNDVIDADVDARERPTRPIPSGRVKRSHAVVLAVVCLAAGIALNGWFNAPACLAAAALVGCIVAYDLLHKRTPVAAVLMGACRGGVYLWVVTAVTSASPSGVSWTLAGVMTAYITTVTLIAGRESGPPARRERWLSVALGGVVFAVLILPVTPAAVAGSVVLLGWLARSARLVHADPPQVMPAVMGYLAGICVLDGMLLCSLGRGTWAMMAAGFFLVTLLAQKRIMAT